MSYNFAVWEGPAPLSNAHAISEYERLMAIHTGGPATPLVQQLIDKLLAAEVNTPSGPLWAAPLQDQVSGPFLYFGAESSHGAVAAQMVEQAASELELVAFDPQAAVLMPSATSVARVASFHFPPADQCAIHLGAVIGEAMAAPFPMAGIVEHLETTYYVQWMTREGTLLIEAQGNVGLEQRHSLNPDGHRRLAELGFVQGQPNWTLHWVDGAANVAKAAQLLATVLTEVRAIPPGSPMELQSFPA